MKVLKNQKGFTLIELIIVIVVLGVLAAVAIPEYVNMVDDARAASNLGYVAGLKSELSISFAGQTMGKTVNNPPGANQVCVNAMGTTAPTNTVVEACVVGTRPSSLSQNLTTGWTGLSPAIASGQVPATQTWTIVAGATATSPVSVTCSSTTLGC